MIDGVVPAIEDAATKWVQDQLTRFAVEIKNTTGARRDSFLRVKEQISTPEATGIDLTVNLKAPTKDSNKMDARSSYVLGAPLLRRQRAVPGEAQRLGDCHHRNRAGSTFLHRLVPQSIKGGLIGAANWHPSDLPTGTTPITIAVSPGSVWILNYEQSITPSKVGV